MKTAKTASDAAPFPPIFVINLKRSTERRTVMADRLNALGLEHSFFEAVVGSELNLETLPFYDGPRRRLLFGRDLTKGEMGCLLSHRGVCQEIVNRNLERAIILEDDTTMTPDFPEVVRALIQLPVQWDMIRFLDNQKLYKRSRTVGPIWGEYKLIRPSIASGGGHAYMVTQKAAQRLLKYTQRNYLPIDILHSYVWLTGLEVFAIKPFPAVRDGISQSTIVSQSMIGDVKGDARFDKKPQISGWRRMVYPLTRSWLKFSEHIYKYYIYFVAWPRDLCNGRLLRQQGP